MTLDEMNLDEMMRAEMTPSSFHESLSGAPCFLQRRRMSECSAAAVLNLSTNLRRDSSFPCAIVKRLVLPFDINMPKCFMNAVLRSSKLSMVSAGKVRKPARRVFVHVLDEHLTVVCVLFFGGGIFCLLMAISKFLSQFRGSSLL
ncbi:unnamed protein product [Microthlaspi erraticum]|uniref:Transmembrane protein n=1 Tax=Microthlaspi erraticum TaxID=1685480 RepID=A0A6D2JN98_9BRAS|nr:unnamed protein product [Microthlaspi erraticum]